MYLLIRSITIYHGLISLRHLWKEPARYSGAQLFSVPTIISGHGTDDDDDDEHFK